MFSSRSRVGGVRRARLGCAAGVAVLCVAPVIVVGVAAQAAGVPAGVLAAGTQVGGVISTDTTWTPAGGPYVVDRPVQIAAGATLTLLPGTQVQADASSNPEGRTGSIFEVAGTLDIAGTAADPVVLDGGSAEPVGNQFDNRADGLVNTLPDADGADIRISHARASDFAALVPPPSKGPGHANYTVTDSVFTDIPEYSYFWYPSSFALLQRNLFVNVGTLTFGTDRDAVATVTNNRFRGASSSSYDPHRRAVESWAAYGEPLQLHGNSFEAAANQQYAVAVSIDGAIDAAGNDWGTTDLAAVKVRVLDREDDLTLPSVVDVAPVLNGPAAQTPAAPPTAPRSVAVDAGDSEVAVTWAAPALDGGSPVTSYRVTATPTGSASGAEPVTSTVAGNATTTTLAGLVNGTAYEVSVVAVNTAGTSPAGTAAAVTPSGLPDAPTGVRAERGDRYARVAWEPAAANGAVVTSYTVTAEPGSLTRTVTSGTSTVLDGLVNGVEYTFTVVAHNANGASPASDPSAAVVPAGKPGKPGRPRVKVDGRNVTVRWGAADANGAPVVRYTVTASAVEGGTAKTVTSRSTNAVLKKVKPGTYKVRVTATNEVGTGRASTGVKVRVVPAR